MKMEITYIFPIFGENRTSFNFEYMKKITNVYKHSFFTVIPNDVLIVMFQESRVF